MSNKKFGLDERASGKVVTITTGLGRYAQQTRITFPKFAKGQGLNAWADYEITGAIQKGVPIEGHFIETAGNEGELKKYVVSSQLQTANIKKGKHYEFSHNRQSASNCTRSEIGQSSYYLNSRIWQ